MGCSRMNGTATGGTQAANTATGFFANNATNQQTQFRQQQLQAFRNNRGTGLNSANTVAAANQVRATAAQFVRAAMNFDGDGDGELNEEELGLVAAAVVTELQSRRQQNQNHLVNTSAFRTANPTLPNALPPGPATAEMTATFVAKALTYDRDNSESLNIAETRVMATALIRTLG